MPLGDDETAAEKKMGHPSFQALFLTRADVQTPNRFICWQAAV